MILDAWNITSSESIVGSSTLCVATLGKKLNQLSYSNIGDCGLVVLRHVSESTEAGTVGFSRQSQQSFNAIPQRWRVAYLAQQQLRSFNLPYQLGFSNVSNAPNNFESPTDADTASIPVMPGDIIILATDGLFDNMDLHEILEIVTKWEKEYFPSSAGTLAMQTNGTQAIQKLAETLVNTARTLSLDNQRDGPFALLAKENDIMWGGGMRDDTTVIVGRVVSH